MASSADLEPEVTLIPVTPFQQNCALVVCPATRRAAVVDPGGEVDRIEAALEAAGVTLEKILVTHAHVDHASAVAELARRRDVPVEGPHREDDFWIELMPQQAAMYGLGPAEVFEPDRWLVQGDRVTVGELELDVLHCPGHTPGHVVFFHRRGAADEGRGTAIVGDVLFVGSIGRTDFPKGDFDTLVASIRDRLLPLGDDVVFHCGHGPSGTLGSEARTNPFLVAPERYRGMM